MPLKEQALGFLHKGKYLSFSVLQCIFYLKEEKRVSMDAESTPKGNVILNIGCGMGSIGLYVMCLLRNSKHAAERKFLFGSDLLSGVIEGAKLCARDNGFTEEQYVDLLILSLCSCFFLSSRATIFCSNHDKPCNNKVFISF